MTQTWSGIVRDAVDLYGSGCLTRAEARRWTPRTLTSEDKVLLVNAGLFSAKELETREKVSETY